jgi:hypothetical protein
MTDETEVVPPSPMADINETLIWDITDGHIALGATPVSIELLERPDITLSLEYDVLSYTNVGGSTGKLQPNGTFVWTRLSPEDMAVCAAYITSWSSA